VLDNADVFTSGTIRVRIAGFYNRKIIWNLEEKFPDTIEEGDREDSTSHNDFEAILSSAFGGGRNYGMFVLPQINEKGIVAFLGNGYSKPVWLGGIFENKRDENFDIEFVNIPSDKLEDGEDTDGVLDEVNLDEENPQDISFIIRTKHTTRESADEIDFQKRDTSNLIKVGKKGISVKHFKEDSWNDGEPTDIKSIDINEDGIEIKNENLEDESYSKINFTEDGATIEFKKDDKISKIHLTEEGKIEIFGDESVSIIIEEDLVTIKSKKLVFDGDEIEAKGAGDHLALFEPIKKILEELLKASVIAPSGPSTPLVDSSFMPLQAKLTSELNNIKSQVFKSD